MASTRVRVHVLAHRKRNAEARHVYLENKKNQGKSRKCKFEGHRLFARRFNHVLSIVSLETQLFLGARDGVHVF
jgi:hypothetical protein